MDATTDEIASSLAQIYIIWVIAGIIVWILNLSVIMITGNLADILTGLLTTMIVDSFFFPFSLLSSWYISPLLVVFRFFVFILLLLVFLMRRE